MALRWNDADRTLSLSVRDLVAAGQPSGHLQLEIVQLRTSRMAEGRAVHLQWQAQQAKSDPLYRAEVRVQQQVAVGPWTVKLHGRVDGLTEEGGHTIVEEVKSTALDATRLFETTRAEWPSHTAQLDVYLWMLAQEQYASPTGRLILVSVADGATHLIGVPLERERIERFIRSRLAELCDERDRHLAWMAERRAATVPQPFEGWRPGQQDIVDLIGDSLDKGTSLLVQAPTGLGKTAAVLYAVLRYAMAHDKRIFWATARTTHQVAVETTLQRFADQGLPLRSVTLTAKDKVCLNDVVSCRPEACRFAVDYYDKLRDGQIVKRAIDIGCSNRSAVVALAELSVVCPFELQMEVSSHVDVVVADYNYAFDPDVRSRRLFADGDLSDWIVVTDEVHQLVDRARSYGSPRISAALARQAAAMLAPGGAAYAAFAAIAREVDYRVTEAAEKASGPWRDDEAVCELDRRVWTDLSDRIDELGLDYALLKAEAPLVQPGERDPWIDLARSVLRFVRVLGAIGDETKELVCARTGEESVGLLCLDPSPWLRPFLAELGGFVGASATLTPVRFYKDLLGLPDTWDFLDVPGFFAPENLDVLVAPRVSTAFKDRRAHADRTAELMARCIRATPGNVAAYFPSFAMLRDIAGRWRFDDRELLLQEPGMGEEDRRKWLLRLSDAERPVVLAAALGGIFAEGIDLPEGALRAVLVCGPALPPVGLERDLLRAYYDDRYEEGFLYASLVPGMTRVVQAAGRLLRRPEDRGVVVLIGRRFRWRDYADLLPETWQARVSDEPWSEIDAFWAEASA